MVRYHLLNVLGLNIKNQALGPDPGRSVAVIILIIVMLVEMSLVMGHALLKFAD